MKVQTSQPLQDMSAISYAKDAHYEFNQRDAAHIDVNQPKVMKDSVANQAYKVRMESQNKMKRLIEVPSTRKSTLLPG